MQLKSLHAMPLLLPTLSLVAGIMAGAHEWVAVAILAVVALIYAILRFNSILLTTAAVLIAGYFLAFFNPTLNPESIDITSTIPLYLEGEVGKVNDSPMGTALTLQADSWGVSSNSMRPCRKFFIKVVVPDFTVEFHRGERVRMHTELERLTERHDLPGDYDQAAELMRRGIHYRTIVSPSEITLVKEAIGPRAFLEKIAEKMRRHLFQSPAKASTKTFLNAAILGDTSMIDPDLRTEFTKSGLSHILALSGLHVGLIAFIISIALYPMTLLRMRTSASIATIVILWCYAAATGLSPSVVRSVIMASVYLTARILQRRSSPFNSLCLAAIIILVARPESLFEIGFQLSFAAVASIIMFAPHLIVVNQRHRAIYAVNSLIAVSISAIIGTALISVIYFHTLPAYFLIANIAVAILLPPLMMAGAVIIAMEALGFESLMASQLADLCYNFIEKTAGFVSSLPGATVDCIYLPAWTALPYATFLILAKLALTKKSITIFSGAMAVAAGSIIAIACLAPPELPGGIYTTSYRHCTTLIIHHPTDTLLHIIATADSVEMDEARSYAEMRYGDVASALNLKGIALHNDTIATAQFSYYPPLLRAGGRTIAIVDNEKYILKDIRLKADYMLLTKGYRGRIDSLLSHCEVDTVLLSADIGLRRLNQLSEQLRSVGKPAIELLSTPRSIIVD